MGAAEKTRAAYLAAMGVQAWRLRLAPPSASAADAEAASPGLALSSAAEPLLHEPASLEAGQAGPVLPAEPAFPPPGPAPAQPAAPAAESPPQPPAREAPRPEPVFIDAEDRLPLEKTAPRLPNAAPPCGWDELQAQVRACVRCPLHRTRTQTVFGVGDRRAGWMVVGEAPGEQEDLQGEPFVGRAGLLLNEMLRAIGLPREAVYIANLLKCRPPQNRDPQAAETAACEGYLKQQLALVSPKIILATGRVAAQNLLKTTAPIGKLRGRVHDYQGVPLVVTYHPAYLLRSPLEKRAAFDDLRLALRTYRQTP